MIRCSNPTCSRIIGYLGMSPDDPRQEDLLVMEGWSRDPEVEDGWLCERCAA